MKPTETSHPRHQIGGGHPSLPAYFPSLFLQQVPFPGLGKEKGDGEEEEGRRVRSDITGEWKEQMLAHYWVQGVAFGKLPLVLRGLQLVLQ